MIRHCTERHDNNVIKWSWNGCELTIFVVVAFPGHLVKTESRFKVRNGVADRHSDDNAF